MNTPSESVSSTEAGSIIVEADGSGTGGNSIWDLVFCFFLVLPSLVWILIDKSVWGWDQSSYGLESLSHFLCLTICPQQYPSMFLHSIAGSKAPGIALFGQFFVPLGQLMQSVDFALLISILVESFVSLVLVFMIGMSVNGNRSSKLPAYLACLVLAACPIYCNLTRTYLVESMQLLGVTYMYWVLGTFSRRSADLNVAHFVFAAVICLMAKVSTPIYCLVPGVAILVKLFRSGWRKVLPSSKFAYFLWAISLSCFTEVGIWYIRNFANLIAFAKQTSVGGIAEFYGKKAPVMVKLLSWLDILREHIVIDVVLYALPVVIGFPVFLIINRMVRSRRDKKQDLLEVADRGVLLLVALGQILVVTVVLVTSVAEDPRYAYGILPSLVIAFIVLTSFVQSRIYFLVCIALISCQFVLVNLYSLGVDAEFLKRFSVMYVVKDESDRLVEVKAISRLSSEYAKRGYDVVTGVSYHWLNGNTIGYQALKASLDGKATVFPHISSWSLTHSSAEAVDWVKKKRRYIFISLDPVEMNKQTEAPFANRANLAVLDYVEKQGKKIDFPSSIGLLVYQVD